MNGTWQRWSVEVLGYVAAQTPTNERYVALHKIQHFFDLGYSDAQVARIWNQGNAGQCVRGVHRHGVRYDSCAYQQKVLALLN